MPPKKAKDGQNPASGGGDPQTHNVVGVPLRGRVRRTHQRFSLAPGGGGWTPGPHPTHLPEGGGSEPTTRPPPEGGGGGLGATHVWGSILGVWGSFVAGGIPTRPDPPTPSPKVTKVKKKIQSLGPIHSPPPGSKLKRKQNPCDQLRVDSPLLNTISHFLKTSQSFPTSEEVGGTQSFKTKGG